MKYGKKAITPFFFFLFCFALLADFALAKQFPAPQGMVSDFAGVIDDDSRARISAVAKELKDKTSAEIAVVTLKSIGNDTIEQTAVDLFKEWGIGKKTKDNGVLLIAAMEQRKVRIEVGYGLEGILSDGKCGEIIDRYILPRFRQGDFAGGLSAGTYSIASVIANDAGVELTGILDEETPQGYHRGIPPILQLIIIVILAIFFIRHPFLFLLFFRGGMGGGGGGFGGGFGGFGGGGSGGGGASRGW